MAVEINSDRLQPAKADNSVVFVRKELSLLSHENDNSIDHYCEIVSRARLTDSLNS